MATAVYMRVSSKSQKVASQRREIERFLSGNDIADARWFIDEGVSGSVMERPALDSLKRAVFMGEVDTVVVYALDRIARNAVEGMVLLADWLRRGVRLIVITLQIDFAGEVGQMIAAAKADGKRWGGRKPGTGLKADPKRVIELRRRGLTIREVAASLDISTRTVSRMAKLAEGSPDAAC